MIRREKTITYYYFECLYYCSCCGDDGDEGGDGSGDAGGVPPLGRNRGRCLSAVVTVDSLL